MKNEKVFEENVQDGSLVRYEINEDHAPILGALGQLFQNLFGRQSKEFRYAKDIKYYLGGWPSEDTPPRAQSLANRIADAHSVLSYIGEADELVGYLADRGLRLEPIKASYHEDELLAEADWELDEKRSKKVKKLWKELFDVSIPTDKVEILTKMMDAACTKQKIICDLADQIKIDMGEKVKEECEIKVGDFTRTVNFKYQVDKGKDITEKLDDVKTGAESTIETLEYFD